MILVIQFKTDSLHKNQKIQYKPYNLNKYDLAFLLDILMPKFQNDITKYNVYDIKNKKKSLSRL